jgi:hypothetical protein
VIKGLKRKPSEPVNEQPILRSEQKFDFKGIFFCVELSVCAKVCSKCHMICCICGMKVSCKFYSSLNFKDSFVIPFITVFWNSIVRTTKYLEENDDEQVTISQLNECRLFVEMKHTAHTTWKLNLGNITDHRFLYLKLSPF